MRIGDVNKRPAARKVFFVENPLLAARIERAELDRWKAEKSGDKDAENDARLLLEELHAQGRETAVAFYLVSIGRQAYEDLIKEHPPTQQQRNQFSKELKGVPEDKRGTLRWDTERFPPALLSACVRLPELDELDEDDPPRERFVEPITVEEATELWNSDRFSTGELATLQAAAMAVNAGGNVVELKES